MKTTPRMTGTAACMLYTAAALCLTISAASADVPGIIVKKDTQQIKGTIRFLRASRKYVIVDPSGLQIEVPLNQVDRVRVKKPATIDSLSSAVVHSGKYEQSILPLEKMVKDYEMMQWDRSAAPLLALCYLRTGKPAKATATCDRLFTAYPDMIYEGQTPRIYWDALMETRQYTKLRKALGTAIEQGNRKLAATAQLVRGNLDLKQEKYKDALVGGYLRTIILYAGIREVQPESIYGAAMCFKKLGEMSNAEDMRKKLLAEFPQSPYSEKIKSEF